MKQPSTSLIGSSEIVAFPELGVADVPAKVDTGADTSSVWASNVHQTADGLEFTLFGAGSHLYTGKPITVTDFRSIAVRNSFGVSELRYKVQLLVAVGDRRIRAWFTLSDRQGMRYPILLGRRLVKNKFLVDVSQSKIQTKHNYQRKVLVLASQGGRLPEFAKEVQAYIKGDVQIEGHGYDELTFRVASGNVSVTLKDGTDIASFAFIYFKSHLKAYPLAIATARYAAFCHVPFIDQELAAHVSYDKLSESIVLATHGLAVPPLLCGNIAALQAQLDEATKSWGMPLVCKEIGSDHGNKNYLLKSKDDLQKVLISAEPEDTYILQRYVPNDGYLRLIVMGNNVVMGIRRTPSGHADPLKAHLNNPRGSVNASLLQLTDIPSEAYELAIRSAQILNRQIAGVDVLQDNHSKRWWVLEVNNAPELIGGAFPDEKRRALAKFLDSELNR